MLYRSVALAATLSLMAFAASAETPLERGTYLVEGLADCGGCHTPQSGELKGKKLAGGEVFGGAPAPFTAYSANITPDKETGIGSWTDAQIATALREGKRPDGTIIGPPMPIELYRDLSDTDVQAIIAYLRSVPAVSHAVAKSEYHMPLPPAYGPPVTTVADVPRTDKVKYGAYLAGPVAHCIECHTPQVRGRTDFEHQLGRGGFPIPGAWGVSVSRNITSDTEDGLGKWSDAEIKRAVTQGISHDGSKLSPPMSFAAYATTTPDDLDAVVAYIRTLPPLKSN